MKFKAIVLIFFIFLLTSCSNNDKKGDFENYLKISIPNKVDVIKYDSNNTLQDYSTSFLYKLNDIEREKIAYHIYNNLGDSLQKDCWKKYGEYYSYEISDSTMMSGYYLKAVLINNSLNTLIIKEVKWK
ncbi:hypothetical protein DI487_15860 [Flavobacterium sediminis]|uniref:Lipoprotein n=1 Tax=Flavobacterium sediminis TaxID=2201181 RepID=A0A2U8QZ46_9FLAO|nr:hypothetical protein [Flavobacterium sediminis]AWM15186.1 hypothetical protein DI487_15860 [Flavobacterium sediminis]